MTAFLILVLSLFTFFLISCFRSLKRTYKEYQEKQDLILEKLAKLDPRVPEKEFFQELLDTALALIPEADKGSISRITENGKWVFAAVRGYSSDLFRVEFPQEYMFRAGREPVEVDFKSFNYRIMPPETQDFFDSILISYKKSLVMGLFSGERYLGNISLDSPRDRFSETSKKIMKAIGAIASFYLHMKEIIGEERMNRRILSTILTLLLLLRKNIPPDQFLTESLEKLLEVGTNTKGGAILVKEGEDLKTLVSINVKEIPKFVVFDEEEIRTFEREKESWLVARIPLFEREGSVYILLNLEGKPSDFLYGVMQTFIALSSLYMREYALHKKYEELAFRDPLTGAYTRHYFNEWILNHLAYLRRSGKKSTLVIFDVDNLKQINDTYGHLVGDEVLKDFVSTLKKTVRETDLIFRYGGDEFLLVLIDAQKKNAEQVLQRFQENLERLPYPFKVTFSAGFEEIDGFEPIEIILSKSDEKLYMDKLKKRGM